MEWFQYLSLACLAACAAACVGFFIRLVRLGKPNDLSKKSGNVARAEVYSYTTAMLPTNKESAYLHIPTFTAGLFFHIGTFLGFFLFILFFFISPLLFPNWLLVALTAMLAVSAVSGLVLFFKRMAVKKVRDLSNIDDFLSNFLTTLFQISTALYLLIGYDVALFYYLVASLLFLYIPVGKLRHVVYFFAARYHLGFFYGWRNSWPPAHR